LLSEVEWEPEYWIHGHIHTSSGYFTGNTHVICNPRGYAEQTGNHLNPEFDPNLSIEI
jgi:Icc-related predicted phosphoesterase